MNIVEDRRSGADRRKFDAGPPPGITERRQIMSRRILSLDVRSMDEWLAAPQQIPQGDFPFFA